MIHFPPRCECLQQTVAIPEGSANSSQIKHATCADACSLPAFILTWQSPHPALCSIPNEAQDGAVRTAISFSTPCYLKSVNICRLQKGTGLTTVCSLASATPLINSLNVHDEGRCNQLITGTDMRATGCKLDPAMGTWTIHEWK